jgi:hypothetical protein
LRIGGLASIGLSLPDLLRAESPSETPKIIPAALARTGFGRAKSCIFIYLSGGPPQHETFDPKPEAPSEIRGEFGSIRTAIPGVHFSELLPKTAAIANRFATIRSMCTDNNSHTASGYWMLTGQPHTAQAEVPASPDDWPSLASVVSMLKPADRSPFTSVILPELVHNDNAPPAPGQSGGFMGPVWNPLLFQCEPQLPRFEIDGLRLPESVSLERLGDRSALLRGMDRDFVAQASSDSVRAFHRLQEQAFDVVHSATARAALDLELESSKVRDRYGRTKFGQSVLLARRLVESGVRLVQVNWPREPGDQMTGNPVWDTHKHNASRVKNVLCPQFDQTFSALVSDLEERGLLHETLVVATGEFGRSPRINPEGGRDHWGNCFSLAVAGAGIRGGQVIGASDRIGGQPDTRPLRPPDLAATILHLLGISPDAEFLDPLNRPRVVTQGGTVISELAGT